jgi:V/A-type H+-transporting ATPase subunit K
LKELLGDMFKRKRNLAIILFMILMPLTVPLVASQTSGGTTDQTTADALGIKYIAVALAVGIPSLGAGFAIYGATTAGSAALAERPELATWILIFAALGEGLAIYGLIVAIMLLSA